MTTNRQSDKATPDGPSGYLIAALVLLVLAPVTLLAWVGGVAALRYGARRWVLAVCGLVPGIITVVMVGPKLAAVAALGAGQALGAVGRPVAAPGAVLAPLAAWFGRWAILTAPIGIPVGMVAAAVPPSHPDLPPPEWTATERRRRHKADNRDVGRADKLAANPERAPADALGAWIRGDLEPWHRGRWAVLPAEVAGLPRLVVGASGSGKSVLLVRETFVAGHDQRRVVLVDCKGDAAMREQAIAAYLRARPDAQVLCWPGEPLDGWRGDPSAQLGRLLQVWNWPGESAWYGEVANTVLRLALHAPGLPPVSSSGELMARLAPGHLQRLWDGEPDIAALLASMKDDMAGVSVRVLNLLASLGGSLDGRRSFDDVDLVVCSVPVMANPKDADAAVRVLLGDLAHHVAVRKPAGERETVIVDELSAIVGGRQAALHVAERGRSAGTASILTVQSQAGLGEPQDAERLIGTSAAVTLLRSPNSEELAKLAGTLLEPEATWQHEGGHLTGRGSAAMRARHRLDLNAVRALRPGQAAVIAEGRAAIMKVVHEQAGGQALVNARRRALPPPPPEPVIPLATSGSPALPDREP
jgi:hypothetical protein